MSATDMVTDILEKHGKWVETSALVQMIADELKVSKRQAYRYIKKAWDTDNIRKCKLPDGVVLNGLKNWAIPSVPSKKQKEALTFEEAFKYRCFKRLEHLSNLSVYKPANALILLGNLVAMLPTPQKEKLEPMYNRANIVVADIQKKGMALVISPVETQNQIRVVVRRLISEISETLHES